MSCTEEILAAAKNAGVDLLDEEAAEIIDVLNERLAKRVESAGAEDELDIFNLARQIAKQAKINAVMQKRNRILNAKAYVDLVNFINSVPEDPARALSAIMVGDAKYAKAGLDSVDARQQAIMTQYAGELAAALRREKLDKLFQSGEIDNLIYEAMFDPETFNVNQAGGKEAKRIAEIVQKQQNRILKRKNRLGAMIGELKNYVVRQTHDPILMRGGAKTDAELRAAKNKWVQYMLEPNRLSSKTFENKPAFKGEGDDKVPYSNEEFLGDIYDNLVSGQHQKVDAIRGDDGAADPMAAFTGSANLAKKLSQNRVIHFATGKDAFEYSKLYSRQSFSEAVINGFTHDAQSIGLMERFGTNPKAMFDRVLTDIKKASKSDVSTLDKINKRETSFIGNINHQFRELDGSTRARGAGRPLLFGADFAGISSGVRMWQNMSKLGMATISSFSDLATKASFINTRTERGVFGSYAQAFGDMFKRYGTDEQKELAYLLNVGIENFLGDVHARFGANDSGVGKVAKAHQAYFRLNGMTWWNNAQKVGLAKMLSADLANYAGKSFDEIPQRTRLNLERYGISAEDWQIMRSMDQKAVDGRNYITASGVETISDDLIEQIVLAKANASRKRPLKEATQAMKDKYRDQLSTKIAVYLTDSADTAIPTPGAKERAIMNQGTERGTVLGEALRAIMQLKGFPITYISKGMSSQYYVKKQLGGSAKSGVFGLAQMMVGTTMMGYLSVSLKDILKGKEPREVFSEDYYLNTELLTQAFVQGGGAGIYGDFLFGEYNRYGQSLTQTLAGATFGTIDDIAKIYNNVRSGDMDQLTKNATKFAVSNTPGLNLFYTKAALDYLFIYGLMEKTNPGYLRRMERRMQKDSEQQFYFPPSREAVRF